VIYLTRAEILRVAGRTLGPDVIVRDHGLLESAVVRPATTVLGQHAYLTLDDKAAALLHSLARNHSLVDGNKRLALAGVIAFYGMNGRWLTLTNDQAYDLIIRVASGALDAVDAIAAILREGTAERAQTTTFRRIEGAA
jgi:death-on-curing protein